LHCWIIYKALESHHELCEMKMNGSLRGTILEGIARKLSLREIIFNRDVEHVFPLNAALHVAETSIFS